MNKKRSSFKRFRKNIMRIPRRIGRFSSRLDASFAKVIFGEGDSSDRKPSHVVTTVACSLLVGFGASRFFGGAYAKRLPGLADDSLLASGWGGMLVILLLLVGFNTATLFLLVDRQYRGDDSVTQRIATAMVAWGNRDESPASAKLGRGK